MDPAKWWGPTELRYPVFGDKAVDTFDTLVVDARMNNSWAYGGGVGISRPGLGQRDVAQYTRDQFASDIQNAMGGYGGVGRHVHLYLNGLYWGLYWLHERPDEHFAAAYFGGDDDDYDVLKHNSSTVIHGTGADYSDMFNVANGGLASNSQYLLIQDYLDVPGLIDYMLMNFYIGNTDWAHHNWYATCSRVDPAGRWRYHSWDAEHSLEGLYDNVTGKNNGGAPSGLHQLLRQNTEYNILFADHIHRHFFNDGFLTPAGATALYNVRLNDVDRAVVGESARWGDNHRTAPYTRDIEWITERNWLRNTYFPNRTNEVLNDMASLYPDVNAPVFYINGSYQHGGQISAGDQLTMVNTSAVGTIYYTTDGSDPREYLTGTPVGTPYTPITLNKSTHVKARVLDMSTWSALTEAIYSVGPLVENLRITEIMYHPRNAGALIDPNEEFIELKNIGTSTLNLNLVKFTEGIHFTFPDIELDPDECVVVVEDQSAFEAKYGTSVNTAGQYIGYLANNGERIKLEDAIGRTILDFEYKDGWHPIADGDGFSLTIIEPTDRTLYDWDEGLVAHWKFDDGSGDTAIDSAGTNNGALNGPPTWTTGHIDGALSFDGDYVAVAPIVPLAGDTLTAQAWIRISPSAGIWNPVLMQHGPNPNNIGYHFYIASRRPSFYIVDDPSSVSAVSPETINADQWLKMYVDGWLKDSTPSTGFTGVNENAYIGHKYDSTLYYTGLIDDVRTLYYTGLIDDVRIYDRAVSESEFQDIAEPIGRWSRKDSWRASVYRNGSPGWDDSGILPDPGAVVINEVMSHSMTEMSRT
ncbi:MAG: CotH kinase family protein [Planctomycetota bacterium]